MWKHLTHPNILPLLGVTSSTPFQLISNWMCGGDLRGYIKNNADADLLGLVGTPSLHHSMLTPTTSYLVLLKAFTIFTPAM